MIGQTISHYKILEKLGEGGMGVVYKAEDTKLDRKVALKFLPRHIATHSDEWERLKIEAKAAAALNHPNIATIHAIEEVNDEIFIVMEHIDGQELKEIISKGPITIEESINIAIQITEGLNAAHEKDIVHRDIKSSNIMITEKGKVKIMDFGLAKIRGGVQLTKEQSTIGTAAYMSPEQTRGETIDHRTDIWSIGIVLYEMLTGQPPFKGEYEQAVVFSILNEDPKPMKLLRPEIPRELQEIVERTLDKDPDSRISSAAGLLEQLKGYQLVSKRADAGDFGIKPLLTRIRRPRIAIPTILMVAISMFFAIQFYTRSLKVRWARYEVPPKIFSLLQEQKTVDAFLLIRQAQRYIPDDPQLEMLLSTMSFPRTVLTTPSGADVYFKDYMGVDAEWQYLGRTPMDNTFMPVGYLRLRIIRQGFETVIRAVNVYHMGDTLRIKLIPKGTGVPGMVLVPEGNQRLGSGDPVELQEYWIDKYEVTNRKYKEFVDAGGYQKREYWKQPIVKDGSALSWEQAMTEFRDATGRLGPLTWKLGTYPDGQAEYPVQGVSWYEAAAYAEFAGKSLPTVYHWRQAAGFGIFSNILTLSNFYEEGPVPGQTYPGLSLYGCFDMAGNVKEWCLNETEGWRYILGGAWNEPAYMFSDRDAQHPFKRTETFGFRCIQSAVPLSEILTGPVAVFHYDFSQEKPVKDDIFEIYKNLYSYDRTELVARMIAVDESSEYWRRETISYNAAYGDERVIANLYIPHNATPPYQAVVFFPGSNAKEQTSSENAFGMMFVDFIPRSGRALLFPVYKGTFERGGGNPIQGQRASRDLMIQQGKDVLRSVDYLETREDINTEKIAFLGLSWGACEGPIFTAIEKRFKASILLGGGYSISRLKREPETNPINFGPRSRLPVLMVNGRYDFIFPLETSVVPMFDLQGAPEEDKRLVLFDSGHIPPGNDVIRETLNWLDRYLGPVQ